MSPAFDITEEAGRACRSAIVKLAPSMIQNGQLTDEEIQTAVGNELLFPVKETRNKKGKKTRLAVEEMAFNRRHALILSSPKILAEFKSTPSTKKRKLIIPAARGSRF